MYRQPTLSFFQDTLASVLPADEYAAAQSIRDRSPFLQLSVGARVRQYVVRRLFAIAARVAAQPLYVRNTISYLAGIDARSSRLLADLIREGVLRSWHIAPMAPDIPPVIYAYAEFARMRKKSGREYVLHGHAAGGMGDTLDDALVPMLAEALERHALCNWPADIQYLSCEVAAKNNYINPALFSPYSAAQLETSTFMRHRVQPGQAMGWMPARNALTDEVVCIPAQLAYLFYAQEHRQEPILGADTSSGAAAGVSYEDAAYRAVCELIERDAFLLHWLNKITPPQIDLETVPVPGVQARVREYATYGLELTVLDITTDIQVPVFLSVLIDRNGGNAVSVSAAAGYDATAALTKVVNEVLKFSHTPASGVVGVQHMTTPEQRRSLWSSQEMIPHIEFLLSGPRVAFEVGGTRAGASELWRRLKNELREKDYSCYIVEVTTPLAQREGLSVVKAVMPELVPLYFDEQRKPLGVSRLFDSEIVRRHSLGETSVEMINTVPHPFV